MVCSECAYAIAKAFDLDAATREFRPSKDQQRSTRKEDPSHDEVRVRYVFTGRHDSKFVLRTPPHPHPRQRQFPPIGPNHPPPPPTPPNPPPNSHTPTKTKSLPNPLIPKKLPHARSAQPPITHAPVNRHFPATPLKFGRPDQSSWISLPNAGIVPEASVDPNTVFGSGDYGTRRSVSKSRTENRRSTWRRSNQT